MSGRQRRARCIEFDPSVRCFKPCGRGGRGLETVTLRADELEALRLTDLEGLYQEAGAARMGVSRTTLSRTLAEARRKLADALINGKRLLVETGQPFEEPQRSGVEEGAAARGEAISAFSGDADENHRTHSE